MPNPFDTIERWQEYTGRDLRWYSRRVLLLERDRLRWCLIALDDRPQARNGDRLDWLSDRLRRVQALL